MNEGDVIPFVRSKNYQFVKELGCGACGQTVLLRDDDIDTMYVCKKYAPQDETWRETLFPNFLREVKILHKLYHRNVVRVFNSYIYRGKCAGFILMEYVDGDDVTVHLSTHPERVVSVFEQVVAGFRHLEDNHILHRDIRPSNILVTHDGIAKIIDFGFGKQIQSSQDFEKSITLNWWCDTPDEFLQGHYDSSTEVYFVGKLFEKIIKIMAYPNSRIWAHYLVCVRLVNLLELNRSRMLKE